MFVETKDLDKFFNEQYNYLLAFSNTVLDGYQNNGQDVLHEVYERVKKRIEDSPMIGNITGYTLLSIRNRMIAQTKLKRNNNHVEINDVCYQEDVEECLRRIEENQLDRIEYFNDIEFLSKMIFKYLDQHYNERQQYLFRCYYLNPKMTYNKLSEMTGFSVGTCAGTIKIIKKDLKENLINFINKK